MLRLGVHTSAAGKIYYSVDRAVALDCNAMQIFARNPRQFRKGALKEEDIRIFKAKVKSAKLSPVVIHAPYTLNLASKKKFLKMKRLEKNMRLCVLNLNLL